jgi:hypothetical protein
MTVASQLADRLVERVFGARNIEEPPIREEPAKPQSIKRRLEDELRVGRQTSKEILKRVRMF